MRNRGFRVIEEKINKRLDYSRFISLSEKKVIMDHTREEEEYAKIKADIDTSVSGQIWTWEEVSPSLEQAEYSFQTTS